MREHLKDNVSPQQIARARGLRQVDSIAQKKLWQAIRGRRLNGLKFRREFPINAYFADFVCLEFALVVEIDGETHDQTHAYDENRSRVIESTGFRVIRFANEDVLFNFENVLKAIVEACERRARPSP